MSEPTSYLSMQELCTRISKEAGNAYRGSDGTSRAMLPIDKDDLADIKDIINDGIRMFISDAPPSGWKWIKRILSLNITGTKVEGTADAADSTSVTDLTLATVYDTDDDLNDWWIYITSGTGEGSYAQITNYTALTGKVDVAEWLDENGNTGGTSPVATDEFAITKYETVDGDIARYYLPENFGGEVSGKPTYIKGTTHTQNIDWVPESEIRRSRQFGTSLGYPYRAAIRQIEPKTSSPGPTRRYEIILYPDPSQDDVIEFPYPLVFNKLDIESGVTTSVTAGSYILADSTREETDDYFNGWLLSIIGGTGKGQSAIVTDYVASTGSFTFTAGTWFATAPDTTSVYCVEPVNNLHPAGIKFDQVIKSACLAKAEQMYENINAGHIEEYIQKDLPQAKLADARSAMFVKIGKKKPFEKIWTEVTHN